MNFRSLVLTSLFAAGALLSNQAIAQEDAKELSITGKIYLSGKKAEGVKVLVYKDNAQITSITTKKNSFDLDLAFNQSYTVKIIKDGYVTYSAFIDANVGQLDGKRKVSMEVDLQVEGADESAYFSDFPNAILRFDQRISEFTSSEHYASHILQKKLPLQANAVD